MDHSNATLSERHAGRRRQRIVALLIALVVIAVSVGMFVYRGKLDSFAEYGYVGVLLVSFVSCATIVLPVPSMVLLFAFGAILNPILVGLIASMGGTMGEIVAYLLGQSGRELAVGGRIYERAERWVRKYGVMTVFVFAVIPPLPIDIAGAAAGALRLPLWKFMLPCLAGKMVLYTVMALAGAWGWDFVLRHFG